MAEVFAVIPEQQRAEVIAAIGSVADPAAVARITPTSGGASGSTFRIDVGAHAYLLRLDRPPHGLLSPARSYRCQRAAADAGMAPAVHHADDQVGVLLMDFVVERPLTTFPGGGRALARALGAMIAQLQSLAPFPAVTETFAALVEVLLDLVRAGSLFADGVLDDHVAGLARIRAEYPWDTEPVAAHNDINPRNVLWDGERLWLVDWELAFGNDSFADLANVANNFADVPDIDTLILEGWSGRSPDGDTRHRLALMRDLHRLFYGALLLSGFIGRRSPEPELTAPTPAELRAAIDRGERRGHPDLSFVLGKMNLVAFRAAHRP